jgi:dCMP deaminase
MLETRTRPSEDEVLLHVAYAIAARGTCPNLQVGAVIARDGRILSTGYNGVPSGFEHCTHPRRQPGDPIVKCGAIHGEANSIAWAARNGVSTVGATMICTDTPCWTCAQMIVQAGIVRFVADREYRRTEGVDLLRQANVQVAML